MGYYQIIVEYMHTHMLYAHICIFYIIFLIFYPYNMQYYFLYE